MKYLLSQMKPFFLFLLAVFITAGVNPSLAQSQNGQATQKQLAQSENEAEAEAVQQKAKTFLDLLVAEDYAQVREFLHPDLQAQWSPEKLEELWQDLLAETGAVKQQLKSHVTNTINADIVFVTVEFENATEDLLITFNKKQQIIGIDFPNPETIEEIAEKVVEALAAEDFARARGYLHPFLKTEIFPQEIQNKWQALQERTGSFQRQVSTEVRKGSSVDDVDVVLVTIEFEKVTDDLILMFNDQKQIVGIDFVQFQDDVGEF